MSQINVITISNTLPTNVPPFNLLSSLSNNNTTTINTKPKCSSVTPTINSTKFSLENKDVTSTIPPSLINALNDLQNAGRLLSWEVRGIGESMSVKVHWYYDEQTEDEDDHDSKSDDKSSTSNSEVTSDFNYYEINHNRRRARSQIPKRKISVKCKEKVKHNSHSADMAKKDKFGSLCANCDAVLDCSKGRSVSTTISFSDYQIRLQCWYMVKLLNLLEVNLKKRSIVKYRILKRKHKHLARIVFNIPLHDDDNFSNQDYNKNLQIQNACRDC
ncbi:hypothetical protein SNEBB_003374 [Seison nebaliae]|nr:hypothetical protein SNEBB_003374 [Seison nebaliae]